MTKRSNEVDDFRKRQQETKAAELKAKLDMVTLTNKVKYGRAPRKIGEMVCDTGVKNGYRDETAKFVLRLDEKRGMFIAEHGDFWYQSTSREALQAKMDQVAKVAVDLKWERYLLVEYEATVPTHSSWRLSGTDNINVNERRDEKTKVIGLTLTWEVVEYSNPFALPGDDGERFMKRDIDEDGDASPTQETVKELPPGLVPYSKGREELLLQLRDALTAIDAQMVKLLRGTPEQVAKHLDAVNGPLLLAAPTKKPKPRA